MPRNNFNSESNGEAAVGRDAPCKPQRSCTLPPPPAPWKAPKCLLSLSILCICSSSQILPSCGLWICLSSSASSLVLTPLPWPTSPQAGSSMLPTPLNSHRALFSFPSFFWPCLQFIAAWGVLHSLHQFLCLVFHTRSIPFGFILSGVSGWSMFKASSVKD